MIGRMVGAQVGAGPTMLGPGRVASSPGQAPIGGVYLRRRGRGSEEKLRDDEEALILLTLGIAAARRR